MNEDIKELYLSLMKNALTFALWPEPPVVMSGPFNVYGQPSQKLVLAQLREMSDEQRLEGSVWPGYADTMIGKYRLDNIQYCMETAFHDGVDGDVIETGVWRGGATIFMRAVLAAHGVKDRRVFVADSFAGLPPPDPEKYPADSRSKHHEFAYLAVSRQEVENNFSRYGLLDDQVVFLDGWFKDTLPGAPIDKLAVLRLDGDMYSSTIEALDALYHKLSQGGFCIIDDFALPGCRAAVEEFRAKHQIKEKIQTIDWTGRYWRKD